MADREAPGAGADNATLRRLSRDFHDIREQFDATSQILTALGRAGADPSAILDSIVERAAALCHADASQLSLLHGRTFELSRILGAVPSDYVEQLRAHPVTLTRTSLLGRVALDHSSQQIVDVLDDPGYGRQDIQRLAGFRTVLAAPMIVHDETVGVLTVWRTQVAPFDDREVELLGVFAAQAAIVVANVGLVQQLETRSAELASKVHQLEALREVGEAVSSSLDLDEVLEQIVTNAVRLTGTDGGSIMEYSEEDDSFAVRSACGSSDRLLTRLRAIKIRRESTLVGRAALDRRPLEVADLSAAPLDPHLQVLHDDGWRSVLAVPILRQDQMIGALVIRRRTTGGFSADTLEILETFVNQSALAIVNARLFRELEVRSAELTVVSRHKTEFLASMSHELRTPLNAVIGFSEVLLDRMFGDLNDRQAEYLQDIRSSGLHLLELLNEILDLSKVEAGRMELQPAVFAVREVLESSLSLVRERAVQHRIELRLSVGDGVKTLYADPLRFKQVLLNLLSNAVKFTPDDGLVQLSAEVTAGELRVTVSDTGIGIPPEDRERIFESFQQGGRGTTKEEGTGLGLTLTRRLVDLFQGRLWLDTTVGVGSTFGFSVPLGSEPTADAAESDEGHGRRPLLVVDDDRASLDLVTAYLEGCGTDIVRARDGAEALELARRLRPAGVVLDIRLPKVDGWDVLAALKGDPTTAGIPVVVVSIVDEPGRAHALGVAEYLTKPVSREELLSSLRRTGALDRAAVSTVGKA
jgi:signal transduction histidine kinase/ActR/RegA family two-component response regulator